MSNVRVLPGVKPPPSGPNTALVEALRRTLAQAESGLLQSFIGTGFQADGMRFTLTADEHHNVFEMMGALAWLQAEYVHRHTGGR